MFNSKVPMDCGRMVEDERLKKLTFSIIFYKEIGYVFYDVTMSPEDQQLLFNEAKKIFPDSCKIETYALPEFVIIKLIIDPSFVRIAKRHEEEI